MNIQELRARLDDIESQAGTDQMLIEVLVPVGPVNSEVSLRGQVREMMNVEEIFLRIYHDSSGDSRVVYLQTGPLDIKKYDPKKNRNNDG